jgi:tetratricopeptide (TPR) repeat protein
LTVVALVAALVRLLYLAAHARSPFFTVPVMDARSFHEAASALAEGVVHSGLTRGFRGALYPILLALPYRWAGEAGIVVAQLTQHAAGVATAVAVAALARAVYATDRAALAAGVLYTLAPVPLFFEGELLAESLYLALVALLLLQLTRTADGAAARGADARGFALAGALLAAAAQLRPTAWLLLATTPFVAPRRRRAWSAAAFVAGAGAATLLFAAAQRPVTGVLRILPASGGVNLYLGNRRGADGLVPRPELAVSHAESYRDSVELFAEAAADPQASTDPAAALASAEAGARDRYWRAQTRREIAADPLAWLRLVARKALVVAWNGEVPNNRDFAYAARAETPLLAVLPGRFGLLFALALCGLAAAPRSAGRDALVAFSLLHAAGVVLFFVADRYRLPLYVALAPFAGGGLVALFERAASAVRWRRVALVAAGALLSFVDWTGARAELPGAERDLYFRSIAYAETGDAERALADARSAAALAPADPYIRLQEATSALALDRLPEAEAALAEAARRAPSEPRVLNAAGLLYERKGDRERALSLYREALRVAPGFAPARRNAERLTSGDAAQRVRRQ